MSATRLARAPDQAAPPSRAVPANGEVADRAPFDRILVLQATAGNRAVADRLARTVQRASAAMGAGAQPWIRPGDRGKNVGELQERLNKIGTSGTPLAVTNHYDKATGGAVRAFQTESGIDDDGIVGPLTYEALDRRDATTAETVTAGKDVTGTADAPTGAEIEAVKQALNPTSSGTGGVAKDWDGRSDTAKRDELDKKITDALQVHLDTRTPRMKKMEAAKAAGQVVTNEEQEGAGRQAKRATDALLGEVASAATLTKAQEAGRAKFAFKAGVNLLDASDPKVRKPDAVDQADWMFETDAASNKAQKEHGFNQHRRGQGESAFAGRVKARFIAKGSNKKDLERYDQFGFFIAEEGPRVLSQIAVVDSPGFTTATPTHGGISDAERLDRWGTWEVLVHEYIHTLEHPAFNKAAKGNRIMIEGFCELFTKDVLEHGGAIANAKSDADPAVRRDVEGGDVPDFDGKFVPAYNAGDYQAYLDQAEKIRAAVGADATRAAFFLGHVEHIGLKPNGEMIDPSAPDAQQFLAPTHVKIPKTVRTVGAVSILTGAPEKDILSANPGLSATGDLPADAHTTGLIVPGTTQHRTIEARDRAGGRAVETKADIAKQHGVTEHAIQRANPALNHREPKVGEWVIIPVHT